MAESRVFRAFTRILVTTLATRVVTWQRFVTRGTPDWLRDNRLVPATTDPLRAHLLRLLDWEEAHVGFDKAVAGIGPAERGARVSGFEHSPWQLVEHMRLAQKDLFEFCVNGRYSHTLTWPDDYWPKESAPPDEAAWDQSIADYVRDRDTFKDLIRDEAVDLFAIVPTGKPQQTCLRSILLAVDHAAYHVGQLVAVRRALGIWP